MQVQFSTMKPLAQQYFNFSKNISPNRVSLQNKPDIFVKSSNISFTSSQPVDNRMTAKDILEGAGFVGVPVLLGIGVANALGGNQNSEYIFLPDGTFYAKASDLAKDKIHADAQTGELSIEGTPINIDPDKLDYVNPEKGIYKSADGNIDIDLLNNKYIDKEHGVFIDPDRNISAMEINGEIKNVAVPNFGSGYPTNDCHGGGPQHSIEPEPITRSEFIEKYGMTPNEYMDLNRAIPVKVIPDDDRTIAEKIKDYVSGKENNEIHDVFGRRIMTIRDSQGNLEQVPIDDNLEKLLKEHELDDRTLVRLADFVNDVNLQRYISTEAPEYASLLHMETMDEFINRLTSQSKPSTDIEAAHDDDISDIDNSNAELSHDDEIADWLTEFFNHLADEA